jgi:hypothetical protein
MFVVVALLLLCTVGVYNFVVVTAFDVTIATSEIAIKLRRRHLHRRITVTSIGQDDNVAIL